TNRFPSTHLVTISSFKDLVSYPNDSDLSWHEGVPVFEYLDHTGFTMRMGNKRILKHKSQFQNAPFCPISASDKNFNPRNT
ncbi:SelB C-terminal domain-containing protein, partial [Desulfosarcina sp. BuS5]